MDERYPYEQQLQQVLVPAHLAPVQSVPNRTAGQIAFAVFKFVVAVVLLFVGIIAQGLGFYFAAFSGQSDLAATVVAELAGAVIAVLGLILLGGKSLLKFSWKEVRDAFYDCRWMILADAALTIYSLWDYVASDSVQLVDGWPTTIAICFVLCLFVGIFEEAAFRGLVFGAWVGISGKTRRGLALAIVGSSLVFGAFHVLPADPSELYPLGIAQMVLKTLQTGICGLIWASIMLKHDSMWGAALVHSFVDFFMFAADALFTAPEDLVNTEYVSTNESGAFILVVFYLIVIATYIPIVVQSIRMMREMDSPNYGWFFRKQLQTSAPLAPAGAPSVPASALSAPTLGMPAYPAPTSSAPSPVSVSHNSSYEGRLPIPVVTPLPNNVPASQAVPVPPKGWPYAR